MHLVSVTERLVLQPWNQTGLGAMLSPGPAFNATAARLANGLIRVAWTETAGVAADARLHVEDVNPDTLPLVDVRGPWERPRPKPELPNDPVVVEPFGREIAFGPYFALGGKRNETHPGIYGDFPEIVAQSDFVWCIDEIAVAKANELGAWVLTGPEHISKAVKKAGVSSFGNIAMTRAEMEALIATCQVEAEKWQLGVWFYFDYRGRFDAFPRNLRPWDRPQLQAYRNPGESLADFEEAIHADLQEVARRGFKAAIEWMAFDRNRALTPEELEASQPVLVNLLRRNPHVDIVHWFSESRCEVDANLNPVAGGLRAYPTIRRHLVAARDASERPTAWPAPPVDVPTEKPKPEAIPRPADAPTSKPSKDRTKLVAGLAAIGAFLAAWFGRKKKP